jgi:Cof subfamily protein (haloacid dehalogenase superfamily)
VPRYHLVAMDVDGTLLDANHRLSARNRETIRAIRRSGIPVVLATGKLWRSIDRLLEALDLDGPQVTCNGAALADARSGRMLETWPMAVAAREETLRALRGVEAGVPIAWYTADTIYVDSDHPALKVMASYHEPEPVRVPDFATADLPAAMKLLVPGRPDAIAALRAAVTPLLSADVQVTTTTPEFLEFLRPGVDKGSALCAVCAYWGVSLEAVVAFGDGENDIPLLGQAGLPVAVANGETALRARARVLAPANDADGVAVVLERLLHAGELAGPQEQSLYSESRGWA